MKRTSLFVVAIAVILLFLYLLATGSTSVHPATQVTMTPAVFNYLPFVAKNWPPAPGTEFSITTNMSDQDRPDISGNVVVWHDYRNGNADIYGHDLSHGTEFSIITDPGGPDVWPSVSGSLIAWIHASPPSLLVNAYDSSSQEVVSIWSGRIVVSIGPCGSVLTDAVDVSGSVIVWHGYDGLRYQIYSYDYTTGTITLLTNTFGLKKSPAISGNVVVWESCSGTHVDIHVYDLSNRTEFIIPTQSTEWIEPRTSGDIVVWSERRDANLDIYGYDLAAQQEFRITTDVTDQRKPAISGNTVVWEDKRSGNWDIYGYTLSTQSEFPITTNSASQSAPAISGHYVVWVDERNGNKDIYAYKLP